MSATNAAKPAKPAKAILVASFGTSYPATLENNIAAIEQHIHHHFPDWEVRRAFTSSMVIRRMQNRDGIQVDNVEEALERLAAEGILEVIVQPTHIINGEEYEKLVQACRSREELFQSITIGAPLLSSEEDCLQVIRAVADEFRATLAPDQALVLMGHGTHHPANSIYADMCSMLRQQGYHHIFLGTVEADPDVEAVLVELADTSFRKLVLTPLMVVAGDHANNDMAGDEDDSWKTTFTRAGYEVSTVLKGLGEYPAVRDIYVEHVRDALNP